MVRQTRSGRFGQALAVQQEQQEQVTPELIKDEPRIPEGRFGRSLKQTEGLRVRARQISEVRRNAIEEAERLEQQFFSQRITIQQAEEEYAKIDPLIRQFIRTTPEARRQMARKVLVDINNTIASNESAIVNLQQRGGSQAELEILERQQTIQELNDLRDEAESGAFTFEDLITVAEAKARSRRSRAESRGEARERLNQVGITGRLAEQLLRGQKRTITEKEAQSLSPQARQLLGIRESQQTTTATRSLTVNELVAQGIPRATAIKIKANEGIGLEEFYSLPKSFREQSGLTRKDFEGIAEAPKQTNFQRVVNKLFPKPQPTRQSVKLFGQEKAEKLAQDLTAIGTAGALSLAGVPKFDAVAKVPLRRVRVPSFIEVQQPVRVKGVEKTLSTFTIKTETRAPSIVFDSRKAGGLLGVDKTLTRIPAKIQLTKTVVPVVNEGKVTVLTTKSGKIFQLETLQGTSKRINIEQISKLPKTQQFLGQRFVEKRTPISIKNLSKVVGKDKEFNVGFIEKTKIGKITRPFNVKELALQQPKLLGKTKTRFETFSKFKPIVETKDFEILKGKILFKDVTKPFARATGKTPSMKGMIKVMKEPIILDDVKDVNFIKMGKTRTRTPLSLTFARQEVKQIAKPLIKMPKQVSQTKALNKVTSSKLGGVGSLSVGVSSGSFNRALNSFNVGFLRGLQDGTKSKASAQTKERALGLTKFLPKQDLNLKLNQKEINKQIPRFVQKDISKQIPRQTLKLSQKEIPKLTLKQINKSLPKSSFPRFTLRSPRNFRKQRFEIPEFKQRPLRMPRKMETMGRSDLALAEGFTARILGLKPLRIREKDIGKALARQGNIGRIRLRPIIIPDFSMKKKRRKR